HQHGGHGRARAGSTSQWEGDDVGFVGASIEQINPSDQKHLLRVLTESTEMRTDSAPQQMLTILYRFLDSRL
ncbi:hypothetical protein LEMLEM_LOCUS829, partial [Lemmus lemmus]